MTYNSPGIYFEEVSLSAGPLLTAPQTVYMFGTKGTSGTVTATNTLTEVSSVTDFTAKFGSDSPSLPYINLYFGQYPPTGLQFCAVAKAGAQFAASDLTLALNTALDETSALGVYLAPEFFDLNPTTATDCANALGTRAEALSMFAIVDPPRTARATIGTPSTTGSVRKFAADLTSRTHSAVYFPYVQVGASAPYTELPASPAVAAVFVRAAVTEGIAQPPAGQKFPLYGLAGTSVKVNQPERDLLNPEGINAISKIRNLGWLVYGARTLDSADLRYVNSRVIVNVESFLLRQALENLLFMPFDSKGTVFERAKSACESVMWQLWNAGALAGSSPERAYVVICDSSNNPDEQLALGQLTVDVKQVLAGALEVIVVRPLRVTAALLTQQSNDKASQVSGNLNPNAINEE